MIERPVRPDIKLRVNTYWHKSGDETSVRCSMVPQRGAFPRLCAELERFRRHLEPASRSSYSRDSALEMTGLTLRDRRNRVSRLTVPGFLRRLGASVKRAPLAFSAFGGRRSKGPLARPGSIVTDATLQAASRETLNSPPHAGNMPLFLGMAWPIWFLAAGFAAMGVPTFIAIAKVSWSTEQGAHGPIVLAIAIWLVARRWKAMRASALPGSALLGGLGLALFLAIYVAARIVGSIVIESAAMYGAMLVTLYLFIGWRAMARDWFPLAYVLFVLPPPGSLVAMATQPLRLGISQVCVDLLYFFGLPVAREGLLIYVGQYILEVKAACGGLNSMISLSAIGLFYGYIRHNMGWRYGSMFFAATIVFAALANFVRVLTLVLITYYLGDRAAQGFLHGFAGMLTFTVALLATMAFDSLVSPWRARLVRT